MHWSNLPTRDFLRWVWNHFFLNYFCRFWRKSLLGRRARGEEDSTQLEPLRPRSCHEARPQSGLRRRGNILVLHKIWNILSTKWTRFWTRATFNICNITFWFHLYDIQNSDNSRHLFCLIWKVPSYSATKWKSYMMWLSTWHSRFATHTMGISSTF